MRRKLEDSLKCLAMRANFKDPSRSIAIRMCGIDKCESQTEFIIRANGILRAIGMMNPETKRSHYKQFGPEDMDMCAPEVLAAIALRILDSNSQRLLGICIEQLASDMATIEKGSN